MNFARISQSTLVFLVAAIVATVGPNDANSETIFESGTLGPTGIPHSDLTDGTVPGTNIKEVVFTGVRFELTKPVVTAQVGGHFVAPSNGTFFGAIVTLDDENDFPDSGDFSTDDFVGATVLDFPVPSNEVFGNLSLALDPGWYALVFGSGLFGATGSGAMVRNGVDVDEPTYIAFQPGSGVSWFDISSSGSNHRFVVTGQIVPEVSSIFLSGAASLILSLRRSSWRGI